MKVLKYALPALILGLCACHKNLVAPNYNSHPTAIVKAYVHNFGFKGLFASEGDQTMDTRADRQRVDQQSKLTGSVAKHFFGSHESLHIERLDKKLAWDFNIKKKTYTECPISGCVVRTPLSKHKKTKATCVPRITKDVFIVKPTGETRDINGFNTKEYQIDWKVVREDDKKMQDTSDLTFDIWTTPESNADVMAITPIFRQYSSTYFTQAGLTDSPFGKFIPPQALAILEQHFLNDLTPAQKQAILKSAKKLAIIKGYPISTKLEWYADFKTCGQGEKPKEAPHAAFDWKDGIGGMLHSATAMGEEAARKHQSKEMAGKPLFGYVQEIQSLKVESASDGLFEVPPGYKLINRN